MMIISTLTVVIEKQPLQALVTVALWGLLSFGNVLYILQFLFAICDKLSDLTCF